MHSIGHICSLFSVGFFKPTSVDQTLEPCGLSWLGSCPPRSGTNLIFDASPPLLVSKAVSDGRNMFSLTFNNVCIGIQHCLSACRTSFACILSFHLIQEKEWWFVKWDMGLATARNRNSEHKCEAIKLLCFPQLRVYVCLPPLPDVASQLSV